MIVINKNIKIPFKCLYKLVSNPDLLKAFIIYGKLKLCFTYSTIFNIKSRKAELAKYLGISENTLRKYLGILKIYNLAEINNNNLILNKITNLYEKLKIERNFNEEKGIYTEKFIKLYKVDLDIDNIRLIALNHKKKQIDYKNKEKVTNILLQSYGEIKCPKIRMKVISSCKKRATKIVDKANIAGTIEINSKFGFIDNNLCSDSIAKIIGKKSKMTGNRLMHRLQKKGRINYSQRNVLIGKLVPGTNLNQLRENCNLPIVLKKSLGSSPVYMLYYRLNNIWTLIK